MRLIDADALPHSWQPDCNGNRWFVAGRDIDAAPTVCCATCRQYPDCAVPHAYAGYWNQGPGFPAREVACVKYERMEP